MKQVIIKILLLMIGIQFVNSSLYGQLYQKGDTLYVNAFGGLNFRAQPNLTSKIIRKLDYGEKIILEYNSSIGVRQTIKELDGNWVRIKAKEHIG